MASTIGAAAGTTVLGYELINEPWAGDVYFHPTLFLPGVAGRKNLAPLYERLSAAIRAVDDQAVVFYEPVTWAVFSGRGTCTTIHVSVVLRLSIVSLSYFIFPFLCAFFSSIFYLQWTRYVYNCTIMQFLSIVVCLSIAGLSATLFYYLLLVYLIVWFISS